MAFDTLAMDRPDSCLRASLDHLVLASPDPTRLAGFYRDALGYSLSETEDGMLARAPGRALAMVRGPAKTLAGAGYRLADRAEMDRLRTRLEAVGAAWTDGPTALFAEALTVADPDGNRWSFGLPRPDGEGEADGPSPPARLQHVVLSSRAPDRLVRFFTEALGFTLSDDVVDEAAEVRTSFLRCSHEHHSFAVFKSAEDRLDHHCYETADWNAIRDWCDRMAERRIPIQWGPGRHGPGGNLFIFVHDPDGNWVELSAELEVVSHDRPAGRWPHEERTLNSWGQGRLRS